MLFYTRTLISNPADVSFGSHKKIWWRCKEGHEWQSAVYTRTEKFHGCLYCAGKRISSGRDFESLYPELAAQWHPTKNGKAKPNQYLPGSHTSVWWRCERGHEWQTRISARSFNNNGCPYCGNRKLLTGFNDLKTAEPLAAAQWHSTKNAPLEPTMVMPGSTRRVWRRCSDGHEWKAVIYSRTGAQKCGCPECAGRSPRVYK